MPCDLQYDHLTNIVSCKGDCDPVFRKVGDQCQEVKPQCRLMTSVKFARGRFEPQGKPECVCFIHDDQKCKVKVTVDDNKPTAAKCDPADCETLFRDKDCKTKIQVRCEMFIDHTGGNIIRCVCVIPPKPK